MVVLRGTPSLRTADGWRELEDETVSFLAISNQQPDICVQPDSGKVGAFERRPDGSGMRLWFREGDAADYWDGERPPA